MRGLRWAATGIVCLLVVGGCSLQDPGATGSDPATSSPIVESDDPAEALAGRAVEGIGAGGIDVVMRIGAKGFRLAEDEHLLDVHGDRVLSGRKGPEGGGLRLIVRDLAGTLLRELDAGMQVPQTAIIRGDDVYFGGIDVHEDDTGFPLTTDRGAWVAHADGSPETVVVAIEGQAIYHALERSPDGRTVGISRCGETDCATILIGPDGHVAEVPKAGLIALTNDVALLIGKFSDVTAYAVDDGAELWRAETEGFYYGRYTTADGQRIVLSTLEDDGDGDPNTQDQLRIELLDAATGAVVRTVLVSTEKAFLWLEPSLSSDRYVAILDTVVPKADEGSRAVQVVDLDAGRLLDVELSLGDVP
jgi:hypothetical protein